MKDRYDMVARQACSLWRDHRDWEDNLQEARLLAWQNRGIKNDRHLVGLVRLRMIDHFRRTTPYNKRKKQLRITSVLVGDEGLGFFDTDHHDHHDPLLDYGNLTGPLRTIAAGLARGDRKQDIADELGVSPARVSQLLPDLRKAMK